MAERLLLLGRQAPPSQEDYGIFIEPGARLHAWTPNHKQVSSCKVAVHRACVWNEGVLDTKPRVTEEEKAAAKAARQARLAAATKMRIGEVARRLKAAKDAGEHQAEELEEKHRRLMDFNARVKAGNAKRRHSSPRGAQGQQKAAVGRQGCTEGLAGEDGVSTIDLTLKPFLGGDQRLNAAHDGAHGLQPWWLQAGNQQQQQPAQADSWQTEDQREAQAGQDYWQQQGASSSQQQGDASLLNIGQMDADQRAVLLQGQQEVCMQEGRLVDTTGKEDAEAQPVTILSTARSRLLRHCKGNQGPSSWAEQQQQQQQQEERHAPASDRSSPQLARVFREVPLFMVPKPSSPPPMFAGHILPRYIQLSDRSNLQRARAKVSAMKKACPPLCSCGSGASPFSATYTTRCACNCPLYFRPDLHEALLNRVLQSTDVI
mmetsp:Transcript_2263/g.5087  ORF Transcript_2263/g.5087 Transcript_2263/m.5087 type:complete len:431 (-) Transcript_2263:3805-5097(-)|eukprot:CAMPEP_0202372066 /NCGR_PEP_ID=MMETSP1127-20130417/3329_1 /ASSEMBLY_ACC=CAM_ASM_000462 /TAXON_ID=3047 /ORGANISM="Dunaliella tertiolecta, Strain CCMP1320" /LENGTH=430 /DNA_ID=CAMNT_0048968491 /DNA_START=83 /DNA_END=1375 /DNA_ORIENTATION=-